MQKITPHLWFDDQAEEAARFYTSVFENSSVGTVTRYSDAGQEIHEKEAGTAMTVEFELDGQSFIALNGGPHFTFTPAISFFVTCETEAEVDRLWQKLSEDGTALMELGPYDWSEKYGWLEDRYGLSWQISLGDLDDVGQKITPSLMYVSEQGRAEEAINLYTSLFEDSDIVGIHRYGADEEQPEGAVAHAQFRLNGQVFMAMDSAPIHEFTFNEAISLLVNCEDQQEIDHFWEGLSEGGDEKAQQCGWLKDKFGVSWQVVPTILTEMIQDEDADRSKRVTEAMLQMEKIDIETLEQAYEESASTRVSTVIDAPREEVYRAFLDPDAVAAWLPPDGMSGQVHRFEPREGGEFRISLTYENLENSPGGTGGKTSHDTDTHRGRFVTLEPHEKIVEVVEFESNESRFAGEMTITVSLTDANDGTEVTYFCENIPNGIRPEDNVAGCRSSLQKLADFVE